MDLAALRTALQQRLGLPSVGDGLATTTVPGAVPATEPEALFAISL